MAKEAELLFADLIDAHAMLPDYSRAYGGINHVFTRCVNQAVADRKVNFSGTFAKLDYILKEAKASKDLTLRINDTRVRLRNRAALAQDDLVKYFFYDLKSVGLLISLIYKADAPRQLAGLYRDDEGMRRPVRRLIGEYLRVIVDAIDDVYITCHAYEYLDCAPLRVCYAHGNLAYAGDWTYLRSMLKPGMQVNIIRPRTEGAIIYPELIILDPDQLINVSTIASCFTPYAESRYVAMLNLIKPYEATVPRLLGNFAGQLLDEVIHHNDCTYAESATEFFRNHAISMLNTQVSSKFHDDAKAQKANIKVAIETALPWALRSFDSKDGIVEPSFISEMLGLQGRMDFLQLDYKVLLEQKSGKGGFNPHEDFVRPRYALDHYVQLLLYMLIIRNNFGKEYNANSRQLHAFLLYSKYKEGLIDMAFSPELVFRAIRLRNELAWANMQYAYADAMRELLTLTPDDINLKRISGSLWERYIQPELQTLLAPIHSASELEREYYFRFLRFLSTEFMMSKVGTPDRECSGFASTWLDSLDDKRSSGNIFDRLTLRSPLPDSVDKVEQVVLGFAETEQNDMSNFRKGDIVMLYPYDADCEPDARRAMVLRCTVESILADTITLSLRAPQSDARAFRYHGDKLWAIEHDFMDSSHASLFRGMHSLLSAPKPRRDLLLMQRAPVIDHNRRLRGTYGYFDDLMRRVKRASDIFLIIGPPGTGKTSYGMLNTLKEELLEPAGSVLAVSYTNRAVDEICSKLVDEGIDFIRLGSRHGCAEEYLPYMLSSRVSSIKNIDEIRRLVVNTRVFVGTTSAFNAIPQLFSLRQFSLAIVDEASQILEPHLIGLLAAATDGRPAIGRFVLIGDHKQLPAVVQQSREQSQVDVSMLNDIGLWDCRLSLFERLLSRYHDDPNVTYMLSRQGRMHHDIADFPNREFYGGQLTEVPLPHQLRRGGGADNRFNRRVTFIPVAAPQVTPSFKVNLAEADVIAHLVHDIYCAQGADAFDPDTTVGVIVPYRNQIAAVRTAIDRYGVRCLHDITIDTVERYQGSQRDYIIYGFTVQRLHQLQFLTDNRFTDAATGALIDRKLNVAMTRAREYLVLVGNPDLLAVDPIFKKLLDYATD